MRSESPAYLQAVYQAIAEECGATQEEARTLAQCYLNADLTGRDTQGIALFPYIITQIKAGVIRFGQPVTTIKDGPGYALLDGGHGPGQLVTVKAMELAIQKAHDTAVGSVWVVNGNDIGMVSNYSQMALQHDFIGVAMTNTRPRVAPWGGRDPILGINPISFSIPAAKMNPIIFDGASGSLSSGAVVHAAREGLKFSGDYLVDEEGNMTNDPSGLVIDPYERRLSMRGAIAAQGAKGFASLIWVEIMAGLLSGGTLSAHSPLDPSADNPPTVGIFVQAIDVGKMVPIEEFKTHVDEFVQIVKASRVAEGFREILLPGDRALREEKRRRIDGIPVPDHYWERISVLAGELGIDLDALRDVSH